jgi:hypothetical protein
VRQEKNPCCILAILPKDCTSQQLTSLLVVSSSCHVLTSTGITDLMHDAGLNGNGRDDGAADDTTAVTSTPEKSRASSKNTV